MKAILTHLLMIIVWPFAALGIIFTTTCALAFGWLFIILGWYTMDDNKIKFGRSRQ